MTSTFKLLFCYKPNLFITVAVISLFLSCKNSDQGVANKPGREYESYMDGLMRQEYYMTKDPALGYVPVERKLTAAKQTMEILSLSRTNNNFLWQERGPINVAGRVRAVVIDQRDPSGNTILAGGVSGGLWRCTNFKTSPVWVKLVDSLPSIAIGSIVQDPTNVNVFYAGTGEGWFNLDAVRGVGILKSTNGGNSWAFLPSTQAPTSNDFDYVQKTLVTANGTLYAATRSRFCNRGGIMRSTNGGASWTRVVGTAASNCENSLNLRGADLEVAANGDLYATTGFQSGDTQDQGRIWKSAAALGSNQGTAGNWTEITPAGQWRRIEIATAPSNANVLYALLQSGINNTIGGIRRSDDGGNTWVTLPLPLWCDQGQNSTDFTRTQAWFNLIARVDPNNPLICYIGGVDVLKTVDGGLNWTQVTQWANNCSGLPVIHADQHEFLFFGNSSIEMLAANDGGIYYSSNGGNAWQERNINFNITQFYSIDVHPTNANYFIGGTQDNGTQQFQSPGLNSTQRVIGSDGGFAHIDQDNSGALQVGSLTGNNYRYSRNGGASWGVVSGGSAAVGRFINPTDLDDVNNVLIGAHNANNLSIVLGLATAGTPSVSQVSLSALNGRQVSAVKVDPNGGATGTVWIAGSTPENSNDQTPVILKLSNAHTNAPVVVSSFTFSNTQLPQGSYISSIDVENGNANHIVITASNYGVPSVLRSVDNGATWTNIEGNLPDMPVRWVQIAPVGAQLNGPTGGNGGLIIATEMGVWTTSQINGAATNWVPNNTRFPTTRIDMLKLRNGDNLLAAATHGRGVFTTIVPSITTSVNSVVNTKGFIDYISSGRQQLIVKTGNLQGVKLITINIIDANGQLVHSEKKAYTPNAVNIAKLPAGMYVIKIFGDRKESFTQQFVK